MKIFGKKISTFQIIIAGFIAVILIGTALLMLPFASKETGGASFSDALFTATSATCVTGLVVRDTASYWTGFGQAVIFVLLQIGGLGIVSIVASMSLLTGRRISLMQRNTMMDAISAPQVGGIVRLTGFILKTSFTIELLGALAMLPVFVKEYGAAGIWPAFFHSVSAFCNAGFDVMGEKSGAFSSLSAFHDNPAIVLIVCFLIVAGGIGFLTWDDIASHGFHLKSYRMQSKVILATTAALIVLPFLILFFGDYSQLPIKDRILSALFQSITPRTAGFNTQDLTRLSGEGKAITVILMLIGGSPGSTAGGMKTTTVAVIAGNAYAVFHRKKNTVFFGRRVEDSVVKNAFAILSMYIALPGIAALLMSAIEGLQFSDCIFETVSALGTVGLSLGITSSLSAASRLLLIPLMFWGRVGGLTLIFAAINKNCTDLSMYPVEKITVG